MWIKDGKPYDGRPLWGRDGYWIFNPTDAQMREAGYEWVEPPAPEPPPKRYSKLKIIRELGDLWGTYRTKLEKAELFDQFMAAEYLAEDDPVFLAFMKSVPEELKDRLENCLWD